MKTNDEGFTLVELLIVIVILGILATVVVFAVQGITDQGQTNACSVGERTVQTAVEAFYADNQSWPTNMASLTGYLRDGSGAGDWTTDGSGGVLPASGTKCAGITF